MLFKLLDTLAEVPSVEKKNIFKFFSSILLPRESIGSLNKFQPIRSSRLAS